MEPSTELLRTLAARVGQGDRLAEQQFGQAFRGSLVFLVRRAIRSRGNLPALNQWVHINLPRLQEESARSAGQPRQEDPDRIPRRAADLLYESIVQHLNPDDRPAAETVVECCS